MSLRSRRSIVLVWLALCLAAPAFAQDAEKDAKTSDDDPIYVELPQEAGAPEGMCALLRRHWVALRQLNDAFSSRPYRFEARRAHSCLRD